MDFSAYQNLASRTIRKDLDYREVVCHALFEMAAELGEVHSIFQKEYQGHPIDEEHLQKELGDLLWGIAELCTAYHWDLSYIAQLNIEKLQKRYPEGFTERDSLNRAVGDI